MEQTFQVCYRARISTTVEAILPRLLDDVYDLIEGYAFRQVAENPRYIAQVGEAYEAAITDALRLVLIQSTVSSEGTTSLWNADGPLSYEVLKMLDDFLNEIRSDFATYIVPSVQSTVSQRRLWERLQSDPSMTDIIRQVEGPFLNNEDQTSS